MQRFCFILEMEKSYMIPRWRISFSEISFRTAYETDDSPEDHFCFRPDVLPGPEGNTLLWPDRESARALASARGRLRDADDRPLSRHFSLAATALRPEHRADNGPHRASLSYR